MAAVQQVFEIAQLFEVAGPNSIESHSVETREGSTYTGSYKETEFCELSGFCVMCSSVLYRGSVGCQIRWGRKCVTVG